LISYVFALVLSVPIALLITKSERTERILLPISDIIQSVPVLAFFPVVVLVFIKIECYRRRGNLHFVYGNAWNLVFFNDRGLKTIPKDILDAAKNF